MSHRLPTRSWGLARPSPLNPAATRTELAWRWPVLGALLATIPAFYIELIDFLPTPLAIAIYLIAASIVGTAQWRVARRCTHPRQHLRHNGLDLVLVLGLLLAALLPPSADHPVALALRLAVSLLVLVRMVWTLKAWVTRGGLGYLLMLALLVLVFCGGGFWMLEPSVHTFGEGLWLAFTTAATVGYGDLVPTTPAAKIFAVFVVLLGYAVLSLVTAAIAAMWVESTEREVERDILRDLHGQLRVVHMELAALRGEITRLRAEATPPAQPGPPPGAATGAAPAPSAASSTPQPQPQPQAQAQAQAPTHPIAAPPSPPPPA